MNKDNSIIIAVIIALFVLLYFSGFGGYGMMNYGYGMMSGFYGFGIFFMILITIALILFIIWLVKQLGEKK